MKQVSAVIPPPRGAVRGRSARAVPLVRAGGLLIVVLALIGAALALKLMIAGPAPDPNRPAFEVGIAHPAPTSFGTISVEFAQFLGGPSLNALTGSNHNVGALVGSDQMQVEATVTITNFKKHTVDYSPTQFDLLVGNKTQPIVPKRASVGAGTLQPNAGIDERLVFVTGLTRQDFTLRYRETPTSQPILMKLGHSNGLPQRAHGEKPGQILGIGQTFHDHTGQKP